MRAGEASYLLKSCYYQTLVLVLSLNKSLPRSWLDGLVGESGLLCEPDVISLVARTHVKVEENLPKAVLDLYTHRADICHMTALISLCRYPFYS